MCLRKYRHNAAQYCVRKYFSKILTKEEIIVWSHNSTFEEKHSLYISSFDLVRAVLTNDRKRKFRIWWFKEKQVKHWFLQSNQLPSFLKTFVTRRANVLGHF